VVILVTEDEDDTRELMKLLLEYHGHEVDTAENGKQAIRAATARVPDVILMDLRMPVMDGFAATESLRALPATRAVPIIAVSAYVGDKDWCDRAKASGCNECVGKPVSYEALVTVIRRFVPPLTV
jgi:two-component system cell cycle response regulator DivK